MPRRDAILLLLGMAFGAASAPASGAADRPPPGESERAMTLAIDEHLARGWADSGVEPAPRSSDAEFLRRVSLDLAGKIPTVAEARAFLDDPDPEKRRALVERILRGPSAANHFVNTWRPLLLPGGVTNQTRVVAPDLDRWLRDRFGERTGFDKLVRELLTYPLDGSVASNQLIVPPRGEGPSPLAFYASREYQPEGLAAGTARLFLGVRIECAQCHDHPFGSWKRERFWEFAANFGAIKRQGPANALNARVVEGKGRPELPIPGVAGKVARASFLDGSWEDKGGVGGREPLADWVTSPKNPYFARAVVNRAWAQMFGVGFVDPVDDFSETNPPTHPELLDELARRFAESGFNLPLLLRAIAASRAYQLTSEGPPERSDDPRLFARMAVKGMTAEQWYDSLGQAVGLAPDLTARNLRAALAPTGARAAFLEKFATTDDRAIDRPTSILQALTLMHGPLVAEGTDPGRDGTLGAILGAPFLDTTGRVEALYLAALTRPPRPDERERMVAYVESRDRNSALADVFWALLNGAEFALNH